MNTITKFKFLENRISDLVGDERSRERRESRRGGGGGRREGVDGVREKQAERGSGGCTGGTRENGTRRRIVGMREVVGCDGDEVEVEGTEARFWEREEKTICDCSSEDVYNGRKISRGGRIYGGRIAARRRGAGNDPVGN
ncbi:hypothetical protein Tco_0785546 [Tanacetum coccineum]